MASANEIMAGFSSRHKSKTKRRNIDAEVKAAKVEVLQIAVNRLREQIRAEAMPEAFNRGHYAAITEIEKIIMEINA